MDAATSPFYTDSSSAFENANGRFIQGARFRGHFKVAANTADPVAQSFYLCWRKNQTGSFALLTNDCSTNKTCFSDAPALADGEATVEQLTPTESSFVPGVLIESASTAVPVDLNVNTETGIEAAIQISSTASIGDVFEYRVCRTAGADLDGYTHTAQVTVISKRSSTLGGGVFK